MMDWTDALAYLSHTRLLVFLGYGGFVNRHTLLGRTVICAFLNLNSSLVKCQNDNHSLGPVPGVNQSLVY